MASLVATLNDGAIELLNAGRPAEAALGFRRAIALQPSGPEAAAAYFNLGISLKDRGRHRDSLFMRPLWECRGKSRFSCTVIPQAT